MKLNRVVFLSMIVASVVAQANAQWTQANGPYSGGKTGCFAVSGTNLFAGTDGGGVFLSTNNGTSWSPMNTGLTQLFVWALAFSGTNLFAGTSGGVFLSTNNGTSWSSSPGAGSLGVSAFAVSGTNLFAGTNGGPYLSTDNGTTWKSIKTGMTSTQVRALAISGTYLFAGTFGGGVFVSTNNGTSWSLSPGSGSTTAYALAFSGTNLFAGTDGGVFLSTNSGTSWIPASTGLGNNGSVYALALSGTNLFAGTWGDSVFVSTNNGTSWRSVNTGLGSTGSVHALAVSGAYLLAGTDIGVWRRPLSDMISTSVNTLRADIPSAFALEQNYPNPFNPSTTIRYELPKSGSVSLRIFNTLGQVVASLVAGKMEAGYHQATWNANVPSGIYFYRLQAGDFVQTKKMILLR